MPLLLRLLLLVLLLQVAGVDAPAGYAVDGGAVVWEQWMPCPDCPSVPLLLLLLLLLMLLLQVPGADAPAGFAADGGGGGVGAVDAVP
jgi:hypothetical protein